MNTFLIIFLMFGAIGVLFLIISLIIGDLFEALDLDFGADVDLGGDLDTDAGLGGSHIGFLDSRVISMFLIGFGFVGAFALQAGMGGIISSLIGIVTGAIFGAIIIAFGYFLFTQESSSSVTERDLIGRTAKVIVGIKPESIGQISCRIGEERVEKLARTRDGKEIKMGETVLIEEVVGDSFIVSSMETEDLNLLSE